MKYFSLCLNFVKYFGGGGVGAVINVDLKGALYARMCYPKTPSASILHFYTHFS